jgi:hypothetical protein
MAVLKAQRQQEKEAEKARKEEKRSIAQERAKAHNLGKRQQAGTTSGSKKKAKVSGVVDDGAGQENNTSMVAAHDNDNVRTSGSTASITSVVPTPPLAGVPATALRCQPRPKAQYTGGKDVGMNISDELSRATHFPPADQSHPLFLA